MARSEDLENAVIQLYEKDRRYPEGDRFREIVYRKKARWYSPREVEDMIEQLQGQLDLYHHGELPISDG